MGSESSSFTFSVFVVVFFFYWRRRRRNPERRVSATSSTSERSLRYSIGSSRFLVSLARWRPESTSLYPVVVWAAGATAVSHSSFLTTPTLADPPSVSD